MSNSKLIELLSRLDKRGMSTLADVVHSPFFNKNQNVISLFEVLRSHHPNCAELSREDLHAETFPGKPFVDLKIRHLMSMLLNLAEKSLIATGMLQGVGAEHALAREMLKLDLPKHQRAAMRRFKRHLDAASGLSPDLAYEEFRYGLLMESAATPGTASEGLVDAHVHLDDFYLSSKLRQACISISRKHVQEDEQATPFLPEILSHLSKRPPTSPLVSLYHFALLTQLHPEREDYFSKLKTTLGAHDSDLRPELAKELHILARNYCIRRMNNGDARYTGELFDLYKGALEKGLLNASDGHFSPASFKNIVSTGLKLRAFEEVEAFIQTYSGGLPEAYQSDYVHFSLGKLRFEQGDFEAVPGHLRKVLYRDPFIQLDSRVLLMKTWYETGQFELLESAIERNRKFVQRWNFRAYHRKNYRHILKAMEGLLRINGLGKAAQARFERQVQDMEPLTEKEWFLSRST